MDKSSTVGGEQLELFLQHFDIIFTWPLDKTYMARMIQSNKEEWFILEKNTLICQKNTQINCNNQGRAYSFSSVLLSGILV